MTDTHDTNLPDKPVELEEDKKTAEVSEPATTETPAEVTLTDKPAESVQKLTKEEILNKLKAIAADVENAAKSEIDGLKQAFYKLHNSEQEAAKKLFVENGELLKSSFHKPILWKRNSRIPCPSSRKKKRTQCRAGKTERAQPANQAFHHRRTERVGGISGRRQQELYGIQEIATAME